MNAKPAPLRVAFLGVDHPHGAGWRDLLLNLPQDVELTAIYPGYHGATASLEERYADLPCYDSVDRLIDRHDFDAAVICLPNDEGPQAITSLAEAGKHVLCEKPIAGSAADALPMFEAIQSADVVFQSGFMMRYDEAVNRLRRMVREQRFGRLINVEMMMATSDVRRRGPDHYLFDREVSQGGFFSWLACHYLDLFFYLTGETIVGVSARTDVYGEAPIDVEDGGAVILDLEDGGLATFVGGYWVPRWQGENRWTIRGSDRWVHWRPGVGNDPDVLDIHGPQPQWYPMDEMFEVQRDCVPGYGGAAGLALVKDWLRAIREGGSCRNTPDSTLNTLRLIDAIYQSSNDGQRIGCTIGPAPELSRERQPELRMTNE